MKKKFTLTEILVAIGVLGLISAFIFKAFNNSKRKLHITQLKALADSECDHIIKILKQDIKNAKYIPKKKTFEFDTIKINPSDNPENSIKTLKFIKNDGSKVVYKLDTSLIKKFQEKELYCLIREHNGQVSTLARNVFYFNFKRPTSSKRGKIQGEIKIWVPNAMGIKNYKEGKSKFWQIPFLKSSQKFFEKVDSELY